MKHIAKREERKTIRNLQGINLGLAIVFALTAGFAPLAQAQTLTVLHTFTGIGEDGANPRVGVTMDKAGNLYGTTEYGGTGPCNSQSTQGCGTVFRLARSGSGWTYAPLYNFQGWPNNDGAYPLSRVIIGADASLYGTASEGGDATACFGLPGCGIVFNLKPPPTRPSTVFSPWTEAILYRFQGPFDGAFPGGELSFDAAGNLYGTTDAGGSYGTSYGGTIYRLTPSYPSWSHNILYSFQQAEPFSGVNFDASGNLYGSTIIGGYNDSGSVFQLAHSQSGWTLNTLYEFSGDDGYSLYAGIIFDAAGNAYGATLNSQPNGDALIFELTPSGGGWSFNIIYRIPTQFGGGPAAQLVMDAAGNLYGTTRGAGYGSQYPNGTVFKLTPSSNGWTFTVLHEFTGGADGAHPYSNLIFDSQGNLYGTTLYGGSANCSGGCGVVFKITP